MKISAITFSKRSSYDVRDDMWLVSIFQLLAEKLEFVGRVAWRDRTEQVGVLALLVRKWIFRERKTIAPAEEILRVTELVWDFQEVSFQHSSVSFRDGGKLVRVYRHDGGVAVRLEFSEPSETKAAEILFSALEEGFAPNVFGQKGQIIPREKVLIFLKRKATEEQDTAIRRNEILLVEQAELIAKAAEKVALVEKLQNQPAEPDPVSEEEEEGE